MEKIVVTRHPALVQYLLRAGLIDKGTKHISHATVDDIKGKHVFGILPNWLACHAAMLTELQLRLPLEVRGRELSLKEIEFYLVEPKTFIIKEVKNGTDTRLFEKEQ